MRILFALRLIVIIIAIMCVGRRGDEERILSRLVERKCLTFRRMRSARVTLARHHFGRSPFLLLYHHEFNVNGHRKSTKLISKCDIMPSFR